MIDFIGHFHPLLVHLPIGFFILGLVFYFLKIRQQKGLDDEVIRIILLCSFITAFLSAFSGYLLADGGGFETGLVEQHRIGGMVFTFGSGILLFMYYKGFKGFWIKFLWMVCTVTIMITGHLGGTLTHGENFLSFGGAKYVRPLIEDPQQALVYKEVIEPIFAEKCWSCHSAKSRKGGLRLDQPEFILSGGKDGQILVAHKSDQSELFKRLMLEKNHDDHMPPDGKTQLTASEIDLIEWWISEGISFDKKVNEFAQNPKVKLALASLVKTEMSPVPLPKIELGPVDQNSIKTLLESGISISKISENSPFLALSLYNKVPDDQSLQTINGLSAHIVWFRAVGIDLTDQLVQTIGKCTHLFTLELRDCQVETSLVPLNQLQQIRTINLTGTAVDQKELQPLLEVPTLSQLYLFKTGIDAKDWMEKYPKIHTDTGGYLVPTMVSDTTEFKREELEQLK